MAKVLLTIGDCKQCTHSTHLTDKDVDYSIVVCNKTRRVLLVVDKGTVNIHKIAIPNDCPLPDFRP